MPDNRERPHSAVVPCEPDVAWRDALDAATRTAFARGGLAEAYAAVNAAIRAGGTAPAAA